MAWVQRVALRATCSEAARAGCWVGGVRPMAYPNRTLSKECVRHLPDVRGVGEFSVSGCVEVEGCKDRVDPLAVAGETVLWMHVVGDNNAIRIQQC